MLEELPVAIALVAPSGQLLGKTGRMSWLLGEWVPSFDPREARRWSFQDSRGADIPTVNWPSARALRGERDHAGMIGTFLDGETRKVRVTSMPTFDPDNGIAAIAFVQALDARGLSMEGSHHDLQPRLIDMLVKAISTTWTPVPSP